MAELKGRQSKNIRDLRGQPVGEAPDPLPNWDEINPETYEAFFGPGSWARMQEGMERAALEASKRNATRVLSTKLKDEPYIAAYTPDELIEGKYAPPSRYDQATVGESAARQAREIQDATRPRYIGGGPTSGPEIPQETSGTYSPPAGTTDDPTQGARRPPPTKVVEDRFAHYVDGLGAKRAMNKMSEAKVRSLQRALNAAGFGKDLAIDGDIGPQTKAAIAKALQATEDIDNLSTKVQVKAVQAALRASGITDAKARPLAVDGIIGPSTREALRKASSRLPRPRPDEAVEEAKPLEPTPEEEEAAKQAVQKEVVKKALPSSLTEDRTTREKRPLKIEQDFSEQQPGTMAVDPHFAPPTEEAPAPVRIDMGDFGGLREIDRSARFDPTWSPPLPSQQPAQAVAPPLLDGPREIDRSLAFGPTAETAFGAPDVAPGPPVASGAFSPPSGSRYGISAGEAAVPGGTSPMGGLLAGIAPTLAPPVVDQGPIDAVRRAIERPQPASPPPPAATLQSVGGNLVADAARRIMAEKGTISPEDLADIGREYIRNNPQDAEAVTKLFQDKGIDINRGTPEGSPPLPTGPAAGYSNPLPTQEPVQAPPQAAPEPGPGAGLPVSTMQPWDTALPEERGQVDTSGAAAAADPQAEEQEFQAQQAAQQDQLQQDLAAQQQTMENDRRALERKQLDVQPAPSGAAMGRAPTARPSTTRGAPTASDTAPEPTSLAGPLSLNDPTFSPFAGGGFSPTAPFVDPTSNARLDQTLSLGGAVPEATSGMYNPEGGLPPAAGYGDIYDQMGETYNNPLNRAVRAIRGIIDGQPAPAQPLAPPAVAPPTQFEGNMPRPRPVYGDQEYNSLPPATIENIPANRINWDNLENFDPTTVPGYSEPGPASSIAPPVGNGALAFMAPPQVYDQSPPIDYVDPHSLDMHRLPGGGPQIEGSLDLEVGPNPDVPEHQPIRPEDLQNPYGGGFGYTPEAPLPTDDWLSPTSSLDAAPNIQLAGSPVDDLFSPNRENLDSIIQRVETAIAANPTGAIADLNDPEANVPPEFRGITPTTPSMMGGVSIPAEAAQEIAPDIESMLAPTAAGTQYAGARTSVTPATPTMPEAGTTPDPISSTTVAPDLIALEPSEIKTPTKTVGAPETEVDRTLDLGTGLSGFGVARSDYGSGSPVAPMPVDQRDVGKILDTPGFQTPTSVKLNEMISAEPGHFGGYTGEAAVSTLDPLAPAPVEAPEPVHATRGLPVAAETPAATTPAASALPPLDTGIDVADLPVATAAPIEAPEPDKPNIVDRVTGAFSDAADIPGNIANAAIALPGKVGEAIINAPKNIVKTVAAGAGKVRDIATGKYVSNKPDVSGNLFANFVFNAGMKVANPLGMGLTASTTGRSPPSWLGSSYGPLGYGYSGNPFTGSAYGTGGAGDYASATTPGNSGYSRATALTDRTSNA